MTIDTLTNTIIERHNRKLCEISKTKQEKIKNRKLFWNRVKQCFYTNEPSICFFIKLPGVLVIIDLIYFIYFGSLSFVDNVVMPAVSFTLNIFIFLVGIILTLGSISIWCVYKKYFKKQS